MMCETNRKKAQELMGEKDFKIYEAAFEPSYDKFSSMSSRRFIKTHLPMKLMPSSVTDVGAKIVYVARNPKDVCVSWFYMHKDFVSKSGFEGDFKSFTEYFMDDLRKCVFNVIIK